MAKDLTIPREFKRRVLRAMPRRRVAKVVLYAADTTRMVDFVIHQL